MAATAAELRGRAQRLSDMEGSSYVDNDEWLDYANEGLQDLHDILVAKAEDYALDTTTITLVSGTDLYDLPSDFYKLRGVDLHHGNGLFSTLRPFNFRERNRRQYTTGSLDPGYSYQYNIQGEKLRLIPTPSGSSETVTLWYVPQVPALTGDSDAIPSFIPSTYDKYIVLHMAMRATQKEDSGQALQFADDLRSQKGRIETIAANRDSGEPKRMVDVRYVSSDVWPWARGG